MSTTKGRLADTVSDAMLNTLWRGASFTAMPATVHFGLSTTLPGNDGSNITEPTDTNYVLVAVARDATMFAAASDRNIATAADLEWPAAAAGGPGYGLVGWLPVWDDTSRTTYLGYWVLSGGPQSFDAGVIPLFPAGSLTWVDAGD